MTQPQQLLENRRPTTLDEFERFTRELIATWDIDPIYPVLRHICRDLGPEEAQWLTWLYLSYYNLSSALQTFAIYPWPVPALSASQLSRPIATERRGFRDARKFRAAVSSYFEAQAWKKEWLTDGWNPTDQGLNYATFMRRAQTLHGVGPWAAYKWSDLLREVHGFPIRPTRWDVATGSGPMAGLESLWPGPSKLTKAGALVAAEAIGAELNKDNWGQPVSPDQLETALCKWHMLVDGRYYVGHDIDEMLEQTIAQLPPESRARQKITRARFETLPARYLGELWTWKGVDKARCRGWVETGRVWTR